MTIIEEAALGAAKLEQFVFRAVDEVGATLNAALVVMGDRLGPYRALAGAGVMRRLVIALAFAIAATAPGTALARPLVDRQPQPAVPLERVTVVQEVPADQTLALALSGAALLVAAGAAGYSRRSLRSTRTT